MTKPKPKDQLQKRGRKSVFRPEYILIAKACARFGAIEEEIADELHINHATLDNWKKKYPEFLGALKAGKEASDDRVEDSLYRLAIGWNGAPPNVTACIFWLKNRKPSEWRDIQNIEASTAHYILSNAPMSEAEWIEARTKLIDSKPLDVAGAGASGTTQDDTST
jgi:Homeodomain-like domain